MMKRYEKQGSSIEGDICALSDGRPQQPSSGAVCLQSLPSCRTDPLETLYCTVGQEGSYDEGSLGSISLRKVRISLTVATAWVLS